MNLQTRLVLFLLFCLTIGCTKPLVSGRIRATPPISQEFASPRDETLEAAKQALTALGYSLEKESPSDGVLQTRWQSTRATSHYTDLFEQKDFGTVGSYYRIELNIREREGKTIVAVAAPVKSIAPHQRSTYREERKILKKIRDFLRNDDFEMTNLGVDPWTTSRP